MKRSRDRRVEAYVELVRRWAPRVALVSNHDLARFEERHVADSLRVAPLIDSLPPGTAIDVGSGAGLPGVPLAIHDPERPWRLLEPRRKRAAFLEEVVRELELNCDVVALSAQEASRDPKLASAHVVATARALAPPERSFALVRPLLAPGGTAVVFAGESARMPAKAELWAPGLSIMRRDE